MARAKRDPRREPAAGAREARGAAPGRAARPAAAAGNGPWSRLPAWTAVALIALAVAFYFYPLVFAGQVFSSADAQAPQGFGVYAEAWRAESGEYPLWNPFIFCGLPSYAALAYNPDVYFPDWIFKLLGGLAPPMLWLIVYYFVGAVAVYFLLGDLGAARGPAALGGLLYALTPNLIAVGAHGHGSQLVNSGLLPLALLALHRYLARGSGIWLALLAATLGAQILRGHVQIAYYTWLALALYFIYYLLDRRRDGTRFRLAPGRAAAGFGLALLLGALLGAVLALPVATYTPQSIRGGGETGGVSFEYATGWSLALGELATLFVPSALGFGGETYWGTMPFTDYPNAYVGIATLLFAVLAFVAPGPRGREPGLAPAVFFLVLALFALAVSLGKHFFLYDLLFRFLPYWKKFRVPVMILVLAQLAAGGLFALGLTRVLALARGGGPAAARLARVLATASGVALVGLLVVLLLGGAFRDGYSAAFQKSPRISAQLARAPEVGRQLGARAAARAHGDLAKSLALVAAAGGVAALGLRGRLRPELVVGGVALLVAIDVGPIGQEIMRPLTTARANLVQPTAADDLVAFLRTVPGPFRIYPIEEFRSNRFATFGLASVGGYHAAKPRVYQEFMDAFGLETLELFSHPDRYRILDLLNVRYLVTATEIGANPRFVKVHDGPTKVYENQSVGPRAFVVGTAEAAPTAAAALSRLADPAFDPARQAVVATAVGPLGGSATTGTAEIREFGLNRVVVAVNASHPALLVLGELYDPGWQARVDGAPAPVVRADHIFRGVRVEKGSHEVEFRYVAPGLRLGLGLSVAAAAAILGIAAVSLLRARARRGGEAA